MSLNIACSGEWEGGEGGAEERARICRCRKGVPESTKFRISDSCFPQLIRSISPSFALLRLCTRWKSVARVKKKTIFVVYFEDRPISKFAGLKNSLIPATKCNLTACDVDRVVLNKLCSGQWRIVLR